MPRVRSKHHRGPRLHVHLRESRPMIALIYQFLLAWREDRKYKDENDGYYVEV